MEKLSEDIWSDIFDLLSSEDIENVANSCKNWRNIITTTPTLMRKLTLRINFKDLKGRPWMMKLPYQNLYLKQDHEDTQRNKIVEFIQDIDQLTAVNKIFIYGLNSADVIQIVNKFQNLTTLIAEHLSDWGMQDETKIDLPNLTHLKIEYGAVWLIPKIRSHKIEVLYACEERKSWTPDRAKDFGSFLQTCDKLKHLTLERFYTDEIMKIKSQLETFELNFVFETLPSSFLQFLKSQKSSLKNLTLDVYGYDDEIANFIYFEMNLDKIVDYRLKHGQIQKLKNVSVKNLRIYDRDNFEYLEKLFQCCEMLEVLDVGLPGRKQLEFLRLLSNLPKLKHLLIYYERLPSLDFQQLTFKFNRLERLIIDSGFTADQSVKLIRCCPNLTHVKMNDINLSKNDFENIFQDCSKIQEIYLHSIDQEFTDEEIETYKDVGSKIKLKIETTSKDVIEKFSGAKNRLTVVEEIHNSDPFEVSPRILSD